jgi:glycosyltransferase involved in cell wall biosynthesis
MAPGVGPVLFPFTGYGVGGSHISTFLLARALVDHGIRAVIIAVDGSTVAREAKARGLEVVIEPGPAATRRETLRDIRRSPARRRLLRSFGRRAIVHCSDIWAAQSWGTIAKSLGLPFIYHHRAFISNRVHDRLLIGLANRVISISEACSRNLKDVGAGSARSILNPFEAIPDPEEHRGARAEFAGRWPIEGLRLIGFSANFQRRKRARFFVEAAGAIAARDDKTRFVVFGRDRDETAAELEAFAASLGIGDRILFAGFRSPPERNIAAVDLLAIPALAEPFGRTLVEAILLGVPYVATDDAGHTEIARRWGGGALVPIDASAETFAQAVLDTLYQPAGAALGPEARGAVAEELRPATHAARVIDVYRETVA